MRKVNQVTQINGADFAEDLHSIKEFFVVFVALVFAHQNIQFVNQFGFNLNRIKEVKKIFDDKIDFVDLKILFDTCLKLPRCRCSQSSMSKNIGSVARRKVSSGTKVTCRKGPIIDGMKWIL